MSYEWDYNCAIVDRLFYWEYFIRGTTLTALALTGKDLWFIRRNWYADRAMKRLPIVIISNLIIQNIIEFYNSNRDFCFLNTLEKMYNKEHMEKLFQFIDCHEFFDEDKIKKILLHTKESR